MARRLVRALALFAVGAVIAASGASCLDPTQITLDVRTDLRCELTRGVIITGGTPGSVERAAPTTETSRCLPTGEIGTIVSTPRSGKASDVAFKIVMGVDRPAAFCTPDDGYKGCIVQRRQLAYVPRAPLTLPVYMLLVCVGVPCEEDSTCAADGRCVPARIDDPARCVGAGCFPPGDPSGAPDAAPPDPADASSADTGADGSLDAPSDGPAPGDGSSDGSPMDAPLDGTRPTVPFFCPGQPPGGGHQVDMCNPGEVCCSDFTQELPAFCMPLAQGCSPNERTMECTDRVDCLPFGMECCGTPTGAGDFTRTQCMPFAQCRDDVICRGPPLPAGPECPDNRSCDIDLRIDPPVAIWGTCGS